MAKKSEEQTAKDFVYQSQMLIRQYCNDKKFNFNDLEIISFGHVAITFLYRKSIYYIVERKNEFVKLSEMKYDSGDSEFKLKELCNISQTVFDDIL